MRWLRVAIAAGCVVMIALAAIFIVHLGSSTPRIVVQAQISADGTQVPVGGPMPADPSGNGAAVCPPLSIAMAGALTGPDAEAGINVKNGVQLAIDKHNNANRGCQVQVKEFDTGSDPRRVNDFASQILADAYTVGMIGPTFSGVVEATGALFEQKGLAAATASASRRSLSERGWKTFFRAVASEDTQGRAVASYIKNTLNHTKVCVVSDRTPYGDALAQAATAGLGELAVADCRSPVVLHTGSYAGAAEFVRELRAAGVSSPLVLAQGRVDADFATQSGDAANGVLLSCPCGPDPLWFTKLYRDTFGHDPGPYSAEGYDLATIMLNGIDAGMLVRSQMLEWMRHYNGQGVARRYRWTEAGELTDPTVWIYKVL